jgi:pSer/pThr/pTyr-binding forkhead associated (FHA) protein
MRFRLRYQQHNLELPPGQFVIGRSTDCQLSLDDPLVSRRHARLLVSPDAVHVEDMGSRNGVLVNGDRIEGRQKLADGFVVTIGTQELTLIDERSQRKVDPLMHTNPHITNSATVTLAAIPVVAYRNSSQPPPPVDENSKKADAFRLLGGVAEKALALGRAEEAERILTSLLEQVLKWAKQGRELQPEIAQQAGHYAARLGGATGKGSWVDYVIELYTLQDRILPAPIVDELYSVLRKVNAVNLQFFRNYLELLQGRSGELGPAERFLLQRIAGLEKLAALK